MAKRDKKTFPLLNMIFDIVALPYSLLAGFILGLALPLGAIAAIVGGVRLLTGRVPFPRIAPQEEGGERYVSLGLVAPDQAKDLFEEQKEQIGGDLANLQAEIKAIIEETRAEAQAAVQEEELEEA
jgi:hypothetical protein